MHSQLLAFVSSIRPLSPALTAKLLTHIRQEQFTKKHILLHEGQVCDRIYFIEKGLARAFYYKDGEEITSWILAESDFIISVYSFYTCKPSYETIELLEDSALVSIHREVLQEVYQHFPEFNYIGRLLTERYYVKTEEQALALRILSAQERYESFLQSQPHIARRAPLKYIASHLRMTPATLSRLRAKRK